NPFDIVIPLTTPFFYNPALGDLLMDVFARNARTTAQFDATDGSQLLGAKRAWATNVNATSGIADNRALVTRFDMGGGTGEDWYTVNVPGTANALWLETATPADGPGQFNNTLDPRIELYSPSNLVNPVATGVAGPDGRNEAIQYQPTVAGTYLVRVLGQNGTT